MTVYSWNILYRNRKLERALEFITQSDFDVFCLQEVSPPVLERLKRLPYSIAYCYERTIPLEGHAFPNFLVILSKHPISSQGSLPFPVRQAHLVPRHTWLFMRYAPMLLSDVRDLLVSGRAERGALFADIVLDDVPVRVFNAHLTLTQPAWRLEEFESMMAGRDPSRPTIVCGDFNVIESPRISMLNWFLGGPVRSAIGYRTERAHLEKRFAAHELANPLRGSSTHSFAGSQLDHILVSPHFSVAQARVISDRMGSDHHPITVELA